MTDSKTSSKAGGSKSEGMTIKRVKLSELKSATYNPATRVLRKGLNDLKKNIEDIGLIYPIAVTKQKVVIDGHRRVAVAEMLGWEDIPVIEVAGDPEEVYAGVNGTTRRLNGNEALAIWLKEPRALSERLQRLHKAAENDFGRELMTRIAKHGGSITMCRWARQIAYYIGDSRPPMRRKVLHWLMKHKNTKLVTSMLAMQYPPSTLIKAIKGDKPITATYSA